MDNYLNFICFRTSAVSRKIGRSYNKICSESGITATQSFILFELLEHDGSNVKDIASKVQSDSSAVTGLIDRLLKENLVVRIEDSNDRRYMQVFLTNKGREIARELLPRASKFDMKIRELIGNNINSLEIALNRLIQDL